MNQYTQQGRPGKAVANNALKDWIVLIVDDQPDNIAVANVALKFQGAQIYTAANGEEGLQVLKPFAQRLSFSTYRCLKWTAGKCTGGFAMTWIKPTFR